MARLKGAKKCPTCSKFHRPGLCIGLLASHNTACTPGLDGHDDVCRKCVESITRSCPVYVPAIADKPPTPGRTAYSMKGAREVLRRIADGRPSEPCQCDVLLADADGPPWPTPCAACAPDFPRKRARRTTIHEREHFILVDDCHGCDEYRDARSAGESVFVDGVEVLRRFVSFEPRPRGRTSVTIRRARNGK